MKKKILQAAFFILIFSLSKTAGLAQNVGIGTASPVQKLHVAGNAVISDSLGIGITTPQAKLHVKGNQKIDSTYTLEFGAGVAGKEVNAGKIGYQTFTPGALDIVGAGTIGGNRKIKFWNEGGAEFIGPIKIGGGSPGQGKVLTSDVDGNGTWQQPILTATAISSTAFAQLTTLSLIPGMSITMNTVGSKLYINFSAFLFTMDPFSQTLVYIFIDGVQKRVGGGGQNGALSLQTLQ